MSVCLCACLFCCLYKTAWPCVGGKGEWLLPAKLWFALARWGGWNDAVGKTATEGKHTLFFFFFVLLMSPFKQALLAGDHHQLRSSWSKYSYWPCPLLSRGGLIAWCRWNCTCLSPLAWSRLLVVRKCRFFVRKVLLPTAGKGSGPQQLVRRNIYVPALFEVHPFHLVVPPP